MHNKTLKEQLRSKTREQLEKEALGKSVGIVKLAGELAAGRLKNVRSLKAERVYLALVKTLLREARLKEGANPKL